MRSDLWGRYARPSLKAPILCEYTRGWAASPTFGTLTIGRHNSLQLTALTGFDPQALSYVFSFLGYSGFNGGAGSTQAARWDNSIRYAYANGPAHLALMYSNGGQDTGLLGKAYAANIGVTFKGLAAYISDDTSYNLMGK